MAKIRKELVVSLFTTAVFIAGMSACGKPSESRNKIIGTTKPAPASAAGSASADPAKAAKENADAAVKMTDTRAEAIAESKELAKAGSKAVEEREKQLAALTAMFQSDAKDPITPNVIDENEAAIIASGVLPTAVKQASADSTSDVTKRAVVIKLIEPAMRLNAAIYRQRGEIEAMQAQLNSKKIETLSTEQIEQLEKLKMSYGLANGDDFKALLSRVDGVTLSFLIAPMLLSSNWNLTQTSDEIFASLGQSMKVLNTDMSNESVRFRSARYALKEGSAGLENREENVYLMTESEEGSPRSAELIKTVLEINRLLADHSVDAEIKRVHTLLVGEI